MFSIGEHVIHPGQGVCTVMGYEEGGPAPMLVLECRQGHAKTRMLYPVAQSDRLHPTVSREEAERLIEGYDSMECDSFTERNSSLEETHFKQLIKHGMLIRCWLPRPCAIASARPSATPKSRAATTHASSRRRIAAP